MTMVLVYDDEEGSGQIHETNDSFAMSEKTACGKHLNPISTTYVPELYVTCPKCLALMSFEELLKQCTKIKSMFDVALDIAKLSGYKTNIEVTLDEAADTGSLDFMLVKNK